MNDETLRERLRNVLSYWNKDESLLLNEGVEAAIRVFKDWMEENKKTKRLVMWLTDKLLEHEEIVVIRRGRTFKVYLDGEAAAAFSSFARELMKEDSSAVAESRRARDEERW
ncbi:MAG: hypothetical protein DRI40_05860 [Chloroflexi bacterium]|nr:MAG: hypothetical protein DRI40_05860 [Chloroflexota bacterium]